MVSQVTELEEVSCRIDASNEIVFDIFYSSFIERPRCLIAFYIENSQLLRIEPS